MARKAKDNTKMEDPKKPPIQHDEDVFHVFGVNGIELDKIWSKVPTLMEEAGYPGSLLIYSYDPEDGIKNHDELAVKGQSAQGIQFYLFDDDIAYIQLPWLASWGDVQLAFCVMQAMLELFPEMEVYLNDNSEHPIALVQGNVEAMMTYRAQNMVALLEHGFVEGGVIGVQDLRHQLMLPTADPACPIEQLQKIVAQAFHDFVGVQWWWEDFTDSGLGNVKTPDGEEFTIRFLANAADTFVGVSQKISLMTTDESKTKLVDSKYFMEKMEGNPYYERVDACQFTMKVMPADEWDTLFESLEGQEFSHVNTFTLKWNPAISSFKYENYRDAYSQCPEGFQFDWSVYEWQKAKKGDHFYMIRVGEGQTGAVWRGVFTSAPYRDEDWSGKGREVYYVDMDIYELNEPDTDAFIPTEVLQKEIPELDWTKGHSGQLLTAKQANILDRLWEEAVESRKPSKE